ncbi:transcriptional regulator, SarA/Rot family [Staphylococcus coagulans]|uniref:transcriptional regulator, SarA/Rot family n=1 Tax=Staphylococcus coagulans TaxID=74706 RepID=UPI00287231B8|nr:regulator [Staphylococcus coagulans]MDR9833797.1 regulator [Staphylococcus coagulans]
MNNHFKMETEAIFFYESNRKKIISELKKQHVLKLNDILFLYHLKTTNSRRISLHKVKQSIDFSLMEIHKSLTALTEKDIIGKERSTEDERKVFITIDDKQAKKMDQLLDDFNQIQKEVLQ